MAFSPQLHIRHLNLGEVSVLVESRVELLVMDRSLTIQKESSVQLGK